MNDNSQFQSMDAYKTNLLPTLVLVKSADWLRYVHEALPPSPEPPHTPSTHPTHSTKPAQTMGENEGEGGEGQGNKRYLKDDYQKNITINVVKCCIREMLSKNYEKLLRKRCIQHKIVYEELMRFIEPILKQVVISLGDLKKLLTAGDQQQQKLRRVFGWFLEWYLRHKYMYYLLSEGKMNYKERYIEYKNKYILYLLEMIREERRLGGQTKQEEPEQGEEQ